MQSIRAWLEELGLGQYADAFEENDIALDVVAKLTDDDLKELGVSLGNRKRLLVGLDILLATEADGTVKPTAAEMGSELVPAREAERRQLTVMFCDLIGSTALSEKLDPEDLRVLMQAYQQACGTVIERYEGHVAQYLGDGLMIYFGWPQAHEDDAERAVRAGLAIVEAVKAVAAPAPLRVRIGIATGAVVVGETGAGDASVPKLAVGETPNLAARLQGLAAPDQIVVAPATRRLVGTVFTLEDLGEQALKGVVAPVRGWRAIAVAATEDRFAAHSGRLTPLVGRETELALVMERWARAASGEGQVILLSGEPGIGKSRLIQGLRERLADAPHIRLGYQCSPYHTSSPLHPIIEQLGRAAKFSREDTPEQRLDKLEAVLPQAAPHPTSLGKRQEEKIAAALIAALLSLPLDRYPPLAMSPQKQKEETLKALADQMIVLATRAPILLIFEDAHWIDPTSLEFLDLVMPMVAAHPVMLIVSHRPEFAPPWLGHGHLMPLALTRLARAQAEALAAGLGAETLAAEVLDQILAKTDGVPLFVEELTKTVLESGSASAIPATLQDSLMARLDRLGPAREVAQIAACIGREFPHELLASVTPLDDAALGDALAQLTESGLVFRHGTPTAANYTFKHALVRDIAYGSLLMTRRADLHGDIAGSLMRLTPEITEGDPALVAHHMTRAGDSRSALPYWLAAAQQAIGRSALTEARRHLDEGIAAAKTIGEDAASTELRVALYTLSGIVYSQAEGFGSDRGAEAYRQARSLVTANNLSADVAPTLLGIGLHHHIRGEFEKYRGIADDGLRLCEITERPFVLAGMYNMAAMCEVQMADYADAQLHLGQARKFASQEDRKMSLASFGFDQVVLLETFESLHSAFVGYPDKGRRHGLQAISEGRHSQHPFTLACALAVATHCHLMAGDVAFVRSTSEEAMEISAEHHFPHFGALGRALRGWAVVEGGAVDEGVAEIRAALIQWRAGGANHLWPWFVSWMIDGLCSQDRDNLDEWWPELEAAEQRVTESQEHMFLPILHLTRGRLHLRQNREEKAEAAFRQGFSVAKRQGARLLELRAATNLARLWQRQGKAGEAHALLAPVYDWFSEGFDTRDLKDAKALLDGLK